MKKRIEITGPDGRVHETELRSDKKYNDTMNYLVTGLNYLSAKGVIQGYKNPQTSLLVGPLPTKRYTKKGHIYSAFREKIDGEDTVVIDDSLGKYETIAQMMHELVHGLYPHASEPEVQTKSVQCLRKMTKDYDLMTLPQNKRNFDEYGGERVSCG